MTFSFRTKVIAAALVVLTAFYLGTRIHATPTVVYTPGPAGPTIYVDKITEKLVPQYIPVADQKQVTALLAENKKLSLTIDQLILAKAAWESGGTGAATITSPSCATVTAGPPPEPVRVTFSDYRLHFETVGPRASYTLSQKFSLINTVSKAQNGAPVNLLSLYEVGPADTRTLIPLTETTTFAVESKPHWYAYPTIHAGVTRVGGVNTTWSNGGILALTWLKHGSSRAPQDTRYALLSPAVVITSTEKSYGVLPISFNLGSLPRQPFTNIWLSPYFGTTSTTQKRFGFVLTAGF